MKTYPLLQSQLGVLLQSMQLPESTQYNLPLYIFMPLPMTRKRVVAVVQRLVDSIPELHTRFVVDEQGEIRQWSDLSMQIPVVSRQCTEAELQAYINDGFIRPFDVFAGEPLFRAEVVETEKSICLLADGHHAIIDGMSFTPVLTTAFAKMAEGGSIAPQPYGMYQAAEDEAASFGTEAYQRAKDYYARKFDGHEMATLSHSLPGTIGRMGRVTATTDRHACIDWCNEHNVKPSHLFQAAFAHVISVLTREEQVAFAVENHGRGDRRLMGCVGMFVKTIPMLVHANPACRVIDFIRSQREEIKDAISHISYPFTHFCSDLGMKPGVMFNFMAVEGMKERVQFGGVSFRVVQPVRDEIDSDLSVSIYMKGDDYEIRVESSLAMNDEATLRMVAEAMKVAVSNMMAHPELTIGELDIVSTDERAALITLGSGKQMDIDPTMTFVKAFEQCAKRVPDNIAVADATDSLTYSELSRRSNILAQRLIDCGVQPDDFVAVKLERTISFPLAVIAIHKAGAAYVPIDLEYPEERQQYMLDDCQAKLVIDSHFIAETDFNAQWSMVNDQWSMVNDQCSMHNGLAYMIYTSGSTGKPKGAVLHQAGLWNFINAVIDIEHLTADDRISGHRSFSFDAHIQDLFPILTLGGSFHIMPEGIRKDLTAIRDFLFEHQITGGGYATPMATLLLNTYDDLPVRFMAAGGEKLAGVYSDHIEIVNFYGPTECTCDTTYYVIPPGQRVENIPIGKSVANCYNFITDTQGRLLPRGAEGELCFAGIQVGRGYWNRPELTAEKFVPCPFLSPLTMYRTGDLCRWNADGELEFIGRIDNQVKLRGYRIELGEIEACALRFEGVGQVVAVIRPIKGTDTLCLYYTADSNMTVDGDKLRLFLRHTLAEYMVPAAYTQMDALPLTPNGKVDRRNLPEPTFTAYKEYVAPQDKTEAVMVRLLANVLSWPEPISMLDNFFSLGGDSIKLIHLVSLLAGEGYTAHVSELMKCNTVREMAKSMHNAQCTMHNAQCTMHNAQCTMHIAQDCVVGVITPGAIQQRFLSWHLQQPGRFTQSVVLRARQRINVAHLAQALQALATHHDMLRATVGDSIVIRPTTDNHLFALQEMTLPGLTDLAKAIAEAATRQGELIDLEHGPILRAVLLHADDCDRLLMVCHHIAIDGVSWRILCEDLTTAMTQLGQGQAIALPRKTHSFAYWTETVRRYRTSHLLMAEVPYWREVQAQMESMALTPPPSLLTPHSSLLVSLEGEELRQLLTTSAKAYNTEINDLLITALCRAYHRLTGNTGLTIQMEGHGREPLHEPVVTNRTVGWFTSIYPVIIQGITGDLRHDIRYVKEQLRAIPNRGIGYGILQYMGDNRLRTDLTPLVGFNYLGEMGKSDDGETLLQADTECTRQSGVRLPLSGSAGELGVPIPSADINCGIADGQFVASLEYDTTCWTDDKAQQLADAFMEELASVAAHTANATHTEPTASDFGATGWSEQQLQSVISHLGERGEALQRVYPLTPMQESILTTYLANNDTTVYRLLFRLAMNMLPSEATLRHTLDYLAAKHEVLRTSILYEDVPQPCQAIVNRQLSLEMRDLTGEPDIAAAASAIHQEVLHRQLSLTDDPMLHLVCMKTGDDSCQLLIATHHIVIDGWCTPVIFKDFLTMLEAGTDCRPIAATTEQTGQYEAYVRQLLRRDRKAGLTYWKGLLADYDTRAAIPSYEKPATTQTAPRLMHTFEKSLTASLRRLATTTGVTLNTVMELGWGLVLQAYCRTDDVVFVKVVSGRNGTGVDNSQLVGLFINSIPVRVHTTSTETVRQSLKNLQEQAAQSSDYDFCPLSEIMAQTQLGASLFQSIVAYENYPIDDAFWTSFQNGKIKPVQVEEEPFCELSLSISPTPAETLQLTFSYDTSLYSEQQMRQVAETYETIIRGIATMADGQLRALPLVTEATQAELTALGSGKQIDIDPKMTFVKAFEQCASQHPDRLAVADATDSMTYGELSRRSDILAQRLIDCGVQPDDFVAVRLDRTINFPLAVIAIHKAGAAYVPIDLEYPEERQQYMLDDCQAKLVIDSHFIAETDFNAQWSMVNDQWSMVNDQWSMHNGLAYMIYTSGSTGKPKGAVLHQAGLWNFINAVIDIEHLTADDRISGHRSFSFDAHIEDMFPILTLGGSFHIMPESIRMDLPAIRNFLFEHQITGGGYATPMATLLLNAYDDLPVRFMTAGGDKLAGVYSDHIEIINVYGPTECTDDTSYYVIPPGQRVENIPIGKSVANCYNFITDTQGRLLPRGAAGELCFAGIQVGCGYWNQPELTAEKFVPCPFLSPLTMYRTGDLCRWNADGELEFIGRIDNQVKLRGFRIELGEIEACALRFNGISQAVAVIRPIGDSNNVLCLYYTTADGSSLGEASQGPSVAVDTNALKQHLAQSLANYMVPTAYMQIEAMPLTPNGKVDRQRLPAIDDSLLHEDYVAPQSELEKRIVSGFEKVLNQEKISVNDDFVLLGGDSLAALKLVFSLDGTGITVADVLSLRTPAAIASHTEGFSVNLNKYTIEGGCPLNNSQLFIFNDIIKFSKYDSYLIPSIIPIDRKYTDEQIGQALDAMFTAHPVLTMHIEMRDGVPYMEKGGKPAVMKGSLNPIKLVKQLTADFDLYSYLSRHVIVRIPGRCYLLSIFHHLIFDAVSNNVFTRHFLRALEGETLDFVDDHFLQVSAFHQEVKRTKRYAEMDKYIRTMLSNLTEGHFYRNPGKRGRPGFHKRELGVDREQVERFTKRFGINKNILFTAAMAITQSKLTGSDDVAFGFLENGRDRFRNFEDLGLYIAGMPLVTHVDHHDMQAFLAHLSDVYYKLSQNNYFPFASLVQEFNIAPIILFQFFPDWILEDGKYNHLPKNEIIINKAVSTQKDFMVEALADVSEIGDSYFVRIMYSGYYSRKMIKVLAATYKETINEMVNDQWSMVNSQCSMLKV